MNEWKQIWTKPKTLSDPKGFYNGFCPSETVLKKGYRDPKGDVSLTCDVLWQRDVAVKMRDDVTLYTDIYRPVCDSKVPAIISWSPYGKSNIDNDWCYNEHDLSHLQKEEGVDPAVWCAWGYAVAHPDARGAYMSEGNIFHWGTNEGKDIYDYVEWLASQEWCNGCVGMAGNSYLTIVQWFAADQKPPHLTAIAPWEGQTDAYRETLLQGGIADVAFPRQAINCMHGQTLIDDMATMAETYPLMNSYWENKRAVLTDIDIPAYIVASYTNPIHTNGTFRAYRQIRSKEKWLRVHNSTEWVDFYRPENQKELKLFFDHYLKHEENGWEQTPRVRYAVLNPQGEDKTNICDTVFPPQTVQYKKLYLDEQGVLSEKAGKAAEISYAGDDPKAAVTYTYIFDRAVDLIGYPNVCLYAEGKDCSDMDLFVEIGKCDADGAWIAWSCKPENRYMGPFASYEGRVRVSLRELDPEKSEAHMPVQRFEKPEPLKAGEIVKVELAIRPIGMHFEKGEQLKLRIGNENTGILQQGRSIGAANTEGTHVIHMGGEYASWLELPVQEV